MSNFETKHIPMERDAIAPDGSDVRILLRLEKKGSMAHFELGPNQVSKTVTHRTVEEIWFFLEGRGQMWRKLDGVSETVDVYPGVCITIPLGTHFQFRSFGFEPLSAIGVTIPSWPDGKEGENEAVILSEGEWQPTV
jgi:mannose-6-phosphate isomerase-like protein (cupin superfamily)